MIPLLLLFLATVDSSTQLLQSGLFALQKGDLIGARTTFEEVVKRDPRNAFAWASLAETYGRLKQTTAAANAAAAAEKLGGGNPAIAHALAIYFTKEGAFGHAAELEQKYAQSGHADAEAEQRVANLFLNAGDPGRALAAAEKAVAEHPSALAENVLGRAMLASGKPIDAEAHLAAAWQADNQDEHIAFDYAQALLRHQDFDHAAEVLGTALKSHADDPQLILGIGVVSYGQRRFDEAITAFLKVIQINSKIEQPYVFLGKMLDQAGQHLPEITAACEKWAAGNPKSATALLTLAKARLAGDSKDASAEDLLRRSIGLDEGNWEAHYELGVLLEGKRDWEAAATQLKRSEELDEKQAMPHYHLARVYDRMGNDQGARVERAIHAKLTGGAN